jgi:type II secretory pathway pseudopilin PulG
LIIVMVIIGILAAIAVPMMLNQQRRANDVAAKSDASRLGQEILSYWADHTTPPTVVTSGGRYVVGGVDVGAVSKDVQLGTATGSPPTTTTSIDTSTWTSTAWCINVIDQKSTLQYVSYVPTGLQLNACP